MKNYFVTALLIAFAAAILCGVLTFKVIGMTAVACALVVFIVTLLVVGAIFKSTEEEEAYRAFLREEC